MKADSTRTEFLTRFPEFGEQSTDVVDGALAEAPFRPLDGTNPTAKIRMTPSIPRSAFTCDANDQIGMQVGSVSGRPTGDRIDATLYGQEYKRLLDSQPHCGFSY